MTKRCLVLGGGGFIGSHLCDALLRDGYSVRVLERPNLVRYREFLRTEPIEWFEGDFTNKIDLANAVEGCDLVYHLVSTTLPKSSNDNPIFDIETNVVGTMHLFEAALRAGVSKIVFASSGGTVYGIPKTTPISETHPTEPIVSYGIGKLIIEKYLHLYKLLHGLDYCILRLANPYGERQKVTNAQGAVTVFLHQAMRGQVIEIWGDGSVVRDYIYIDDVTSALLKAGSIQGVDERLFNIGSGQGSSLNQILAAIEQLLGRPVARRYLPGRPFDVPTNVLDISRARDYLGWTPQTRLADGLQRTLFSFERDGVV
jgi:UDP-glucose 4-epimerase